MPVRVLVLENDLLVAGLLKEVLCRRGHQVWTCESGGEALNFLAQTSVDLLITDLFLAGMSGLEVVDQLVSNQVRIPVIVISGYLDGDTLVQLEKNPLVKGWLKKPFDIQELTSLVESSTGATPLES